MGRSEDLFFQGNGMLDLVIWICFLSYFEWPKLVVQCVRASPEVLSMWLHSKNYMKKVKISIPAWVMRMVWLIIIVQVAVASKRRRKGYTKYDLTVGERLWLMHNDWSRWFAISSPPLFIVQVSWVREQKSK